MQRIVVINGDTLESASVGALEGFMHPISVTREMIKRLPHVMLVGAGARQFALVCGFPETDILSPESKEQYAKWRASTDFSESRSRPSAG